MADTSIRDDVKREALKAELLELFGRAFNAGGFDADWHPDQLVEEAIQAMGRLGCPACHVAGSMRYLGELARELQAEIRNLDVSAASTLREIEGVIEREAR